MALYGGNIFSNGLGSARRRREAEGGDWAKKLGLTFKTNLVTHGVKVEVSTTVWPSLRGGSARPPGRSSTSHQGSRQSWPTR